MSSSSSAVTWGATLPELRAVSPAAMDPARVEGAVRDGYAAGHAAGLQDGHAAGYRAGLEEGRHALDAERRRLAGALAALERQLADLGRADAAVRAAFEAHVVDTALLVAEAILGRELAVAADPGRDGLVRTLQVAPTGISTATVRLHPGDADRLGPVDDLAAGVAITVVADPAVAPGGCLLQTGDTSVDASVQAALARVREVLGCG